MNGFRLASLLEFVYNVYIPCDFSLLPHQHRIDLGYKDSYHPN